MHLLLILLFLSLSSVLFLSFTLSPSLYHRRSLSLLLYPTFTPALYPRNVGILLETCSSTASWAQRSSLRRLFSLSLALSLSLPPSLTHTHTFALSIRPTSFLPPLPPLPYSVSSRPP